MPYRTGSWGSQAKERSRNRREYFKEYSKKNPQHTALGKHLGFRGIPVPLIRDVVKRANDLCEQCGQKGELIHHKDEDPGNDIIENLQLLCKGCHNTIHKSGEKHHNWKGDEATPSAKYQRQWRSKKMVEGGEM